MWFFSKPFPRQNSDEMNRLMDELIQIGLEWVIKMIAKNKKLGKDLAAHLEACWNRIGNF